MILSEVLKIGEVREVYGHKIKVGIYSEKNVEYLNYDGIPIKNVGIGSFIIIRKGFLNIIGKVDGEFITATSLESGYAEKGRGIARTLDVSVLGHLENDQFVFGVIELPLIGNFVYIIDESLQKNILDHHSQFALNLGTLIEYDNYPFKLDLQELICSHIGIFGNTGSGKSNTLAKIYTELFENYSSNQQFKKNSAFVFFDLNGEYRNSFPNGHYYELNSIENEKYPLNERYLTDIEFWSVVLQASEKTQKPFINECIKNYKKCKQSSNYFTTQKLSELVFYSQKNYGDIRAFIIHIFTCLELEDEIISFDDNVSIEYKKLISNTRGQLDYLATYNELFGDMDDKVISVSHLDDIQIFSLIVYYTYCKELNKGKISTQNIIQLFNRMDKILSELGNIFEFKGDCPNEHVVIISLFNLNAELKKLVTYIICRDKYESHKRHRGNERLQSSLHLIIEEAHNILSYESARESEEWKNTRLETFEEIIKEGRKFGVFLTIASQRPADISETIISQLHNFFVHRLVNAEDLKRIYKSVAFSDSVSNNMIPILPAGGCLFSGIAANFPLLAKIDCLEQSIAPNSSNVNLIDIWGLK